MSLPRQRPKTDQGHAHVHFLQEMLLFYFDSILALVEARAESVFRLVSRLDDKHLFFLCSSQNNSLLDLISE